MDDRQNMRASDRDRQEVVDRLRTALDDGRLKMDEYVDRVGVAYEAVTYGELARLHADLPVAGQQPAGPPRPASRGNVVRQGPFASLPTPLKVLWTIWLVPVLINVVVWILVSATRGDLVYPWPLWVAGPSGAALLAVSIGVTQIKRSHQPAPRQLPPPGTGQLPPGAGGGNG